MSEYNYLGLVNDINERLNEVPLSESNFLSAAGFYATAKSAVNSSINYINSKEYQWPFNHRYGKIILKTDGRIKYPYPDNTKVVDFDTFRVKTKLGDFDPEDFAPEDFNTQNTTNNDLNYLQAITYDKFVAYYNHYEYNLQQANIPRYVFQTQDRQIGLIPCADKKYTVEYEYWLHAVPLEAYDDVPTIPEAFRYIINEGAMYYVYFFRDDKEAAAMSKQRVDQEIEIMRKIYINKHMEISSRVRVP